MAMADPRIERILYKLLEPNFEPRNDVYLNLLLTHLTSVSSENKDGAPHKEANKELILQWMKRAVSKWENTKTISSATTFTFTLNLMSYLIKDEITFLKLNNECMFDRLLAIITNSFNHSGIQPNIELAFIKLLSSCLNHTLGLQWIISTKHWHFAMRSSLNPNNVYISEEGYEFIATLLQKSTIIDSVNARNILKIILIPLMNAGNVETNECGVTTVIDEKALYLSITPVIFFLTRILEIFIENENTESVKAIILILAEHFHFDKMLEMLTTSVINEEFSFNLHKVYIIWSFLFLYFKHGDRAVVFQEKMEKKILNIFYDATSRLNMVNMLKLLHLSLTYWNNLKSKIKSLKWNSTQKSLGKQLLVLQMFPVCAIGNNEVDDDGEFSRVVCTKTFYDQILPDTLRVRYKWKTHMKEAFSFNDGIVALKYFLLSKTNYSRETAVLAFQILIYIVKDITDLLTRRPNLKNAFETQPELIILLLECIRVIIDEFTITWKDSVETLCLIQTIHALIRVTMWPTNIIISCLQVIAKALERYMTPEMALLIDTTEDSAIYIVLSIMKTKFHGFDWDVKKSAIELIRTITVSTYTKFSSLGTILLMNEFPTTILQIAIKEGNPCVRATCFRCLQEMVKVDEIWDVLLNRDHISEILIGMLYMERDVTIQTEAVALIDSIYQNHDLPDYILSNIYETMYHTVVANQQWETRVNALKFWKHVIDKHLTQQGMIDDKFPKFIFSKEMRKIINLTPVQVKIRLIKILEQLAQIGCLSSFQVALQQDLDKEVIKFASAAIADFVNLLKEYNIATSDVISHSIISNPSYQSPESRPSTGSEDDPKYNSYSSSNDSMVDDIDTLGANLLESIFNSLDANTDENVEMKSRKIISPKEFLELVYSDHVRQSLTWTEDVDNFDSLLDDMLKEYEVEDSIVGMEYY